MGAGFYAFMATLAKAGVSLISDPHVLSVAGGAGLGQLALTTGIGLSTMNSIRGLLGTGLSAVTKAISDIYAGLSTEAIFTALSSLSLPTIALGTTSVGILTYIAYQYMKSEAGKDEKKFNNA